MKRYILALSAIIIPLLSHAQSIRRHQVSAYINLGFDMKDYPNSFRKYANEITLPLYSKLTEKDVEYIISTFTNVVKEYLK